MRLFSFVSAVNKASGEGAHTYISIYILKVIC